MRFLELGKELDEHIELAKRAKAPRHFPEAATELVRGGRVKPKNGHQFSQTAGGDPDLVHGAHVPPGGSR
jgi:hypothetical protein